MAVMIRLHDVSFRYRGPHSRPLLDRLNLTIDRGETVLLCGASGSGKSTLAYLLNGLIPHHFEGELSGSVTVAGRDSASVPVASFLDRVGLVLQNSDAQLFNSTVEGEIAYGLESLGWPAATIFERLDQVARQLRIESLLERSPQSLSGGEKRLVALASVLAMDPPILVLDEPFSHLDPATAERLRAALRRLRASGKTILVIEQRLTAALADTDRCILLEDGRVAFDGPSSHAAQLLRSRHLIPQYPERQGIGRMPGEFSEPLLEVKSLSCELGTSSLFSDLSFTLASGRITALVGPIGSGKTTLIRHLNGLARPRGSEILLEGESISGKTPEQLADRVAVTFQNANDQFFKTRVADELLAGPRAMGRFDEAWLERIRHLFQLHELEQRSPYRLSEGQKKRVSLAAALAVKPKLLVLDEPTVGQDGRFLEQLAGLLLELRRQGMTILIATHDLDFARALADQWIRLGPERKGTFEPCPEKLAVTA